MKKNISLTFLLFGFTFSLLAQSTSIVQNLKDLADVNGSIGASRFINDYEVSIADEKMPDSQKLLYIRTLLNDVMENSVLNFGNIYNDLIPISSSERKERDYVEFEKYLNSVKGRKVKLTFNDPSEWLYELGETPQKDRTTTIYIKKNVSFVYENAQVKQANTLAYRFLMNDQDNPRLIGIKKVDKLPETAHLLTKEQIEKLTVKPISDSFNIEVNTDRGRVNVEYAESEKMKLKVKISAKGIFYTRIIYKFQDGSLTLLSPQEFPQKTDSPSEIIEIGEFECAAPFGIEELIVFVSNKPFCPLRTEIRDGYYFILDKELKLNNCSRGMKLMGADVVEDRIKITTKPKM